VCGAELVQEAAGVWLDTFSYTRGANDPVGTLTYAFSQILADTQVSGVDLVPVKPPEIDTIAVAGL